MHEDKIKLIEAALFVAGKPISLAELYQIVKIPKPKIAKLIETMKEQYAERGLRIVEFDGLYEMKINNSYEGHVSSLAPHKDFPKAVLQTLSLIAYKNPVKQSNIVEVRGNRAYDHLNELESKGFIRREAAGHTNIVNITRKFLDYFGIESAGELREYFGATNIDDVLKDVEVKKKKVEEVPEDEPEVVAIDSEDLSFSEEDDLPENLRAIVEKKKELMLKRQEKTGYLPEEARLDISTVVKKNEDSDDKKDEVVVDETEESCENVKNDDDSKDEVPKKFKSSFDDLID